MKGNGRLAVYAWMDNDQEWYAESAQPIALGFWGPVALLFDYDSTLGNGTLILYYQGQPIAFSNCTGSRTFTPASQNLVFGGDGVTQVGFYDHFAPIQIDRSFWDGTFKNVQDLIAWLTDVSARQGVCMGKPYSTLTNLMHCYWVVQSPTKNWNDAFTACGRYA
uniref:Uncharacterized protein n=1 Tax=Romanomermis culicivorax TaxID=13658 RepID=A0A915J9W0_ROMCU